MSRKLPTPVSPMRAAHLIWLALLRPARFAQLEQEDNAILNSSPNTSAVQGVLVIRQALFQSLVFVVVAGLIGWLAGYLVTEALGSARGRFVVGLQVVGAVVLSWATLAVRGWDILTYVGVTLTERVNLWIYRALYCVGTALLVCSLAI